MFNDLLFKERTLCTNSLCHVKKLRLIDCTYNFNSNVVVYYSCFVIGQYCNFHGINSTVEIS